MQKTIVITGATSGIGEAVAVQLAEKGCQLVVIGRSEAKGTALERKLKALRPDLEFDYHVAELSDSRSLKAVAEAIGAKYPVIDVLINNAGGVFSSFELTADGVEKTMANNHLNYFVLTLKLIPNLQRSEDGRILLVSSGSHYGAELDFDSFTGNRNYGIFGAYRQSKLANVMFCYALARRLEGSTVNAVVLHPGVVSTSIGEKSGKAFHRFAWRLFKKIRKMSTPAESAETYVRLALDPEAKQHHGVYFHDGKLEQSSEESYDEDVQEKLWKWSEEVTGIRWEEGAG